MHWHCWKDSLKTMLHVTVTIKPRLNYKVVHPKRKKIIHVAPQILRILQTFKYKSVQNSMTLQSYFLVSFQRISSKLGNLTCFKVFFIPMSTDVHSLVPVKSWKMWRGLRLIMHNALDMVKTKSIFKLYTSK